MGINDFVIVNTEVKGKITIDVNTQFNDIKADYVTISENVTARLFGTVAKKLTLKNGSRLYMHGSILGEVKNEGGEIHVFSK